MTSQSRRVSPARGTSRSRVRFPGSFRQRRSCRMAALRIRHRDNSVDLTRGFDLYGRVASNDGMNNHAAFADNGWLEVEFDARGYIPLGSSRTSLALRSRGQFKNPKRRKPEGPNCSPGPSIVQPSLISARISKQIRRVCNFFSASFCVLSHAGIIAVRLLECLLCKEQGTGMEPSTVSESARVPCSKPFVPSPSCPNSSWLLC